MGKKKKIINQKKKNFYKKKNHNFLGNLHIHSSYKNTILYLTTKKGKLIKQFSTKSLKKTTFKKNTPINIQFIVEKLNKVIKLKRILKLNLIFKGKGYGRRHVPRNLIKNVRFPYVFEKVPTPFNGCRKKKKKRR
jgi:small subunit ribosomal protein S11